MQCKISSTFRPHLPHQANILTGKVGSKDASPVVAGRRRPISNRKAIYHSLALALSFLMPIYSAADEPIATRREPGLIARPARETAQIADFVGRWKSVGNGSYGNGVRLWIDLFDDQSASIQGFGECGTERDPGECKWGSASATIDGDALVGTWNFDQSRSTIRLWLQKGRLVGSIVDRYKPARSEYNGVTNYVFLRY
jgi:hypothetical protein